MRHTTKVISNMETGEFFITSYYSQKHGLGSDWVHAEHNYNRHDTVSKYYSGYVWGNYGKSPIWKEIPNPQKEYQA